MILAGGDKCHRKFRLLFPQPPHDIHPGDPAHVDIHENHVKPSRQVIFEERLAALEGGDIDRDRRCLCQARQPFQLLFIVLTDREL